MASRRSLYEVLNVSADAEPVVIEAAYRALMKKYHPDPAPAPAAAGRSSASEINQAFAVLRDPAQRADYDRREGVRHQQFHLAEYQPPPPRRSGFGWAGWFVALLLGGIVYVLIEGQGGIVPPAARLGNGNAPAESAEFDHRSQPEVIPPFLASPSPTAIDREIVAREAAAAKAAAAARRARPEAESGDELDIPELPPAAALPAESAYRRVRKAQRRRTAPRPADESEEDFLKREGYVY